MKNGATTTKKQASRNDAERTNTYAIVESPLPVADYVSTISVASVPDGKSNVTWSSSFDAKDASDEDAVNAITSIYYAGLNNLDEHFNK
jgi:hypothetical protein